MAKDWFKRERITSLSELSRGAKVHVIGVAGVAMAQLAVALTEQGYRVSGSDKEFYEPMGSFLKQSSVQLFQGYAEKNVPADADLVVIGNAISYGNPEVAVVENRGLKYTLFPQILAETAIGDRHSIVVTGTHGKTTTTALCAVTLSKLGLNPSYFIGGAVPELPRSLAIGSGNISVVEGDEYDSAFFAKTPKFHFYRTKTCIVNAIEYDHADIYPNIEAIQREFEALLLSLPQDGLAICCIDFPKVREVLASVTPRLKARCLTFGEASESDIRIERITPHGLSQEVLIRHPESGKVTLNVSIPGAHNARNAVAVYAACISRGIRSTSIIEAMATFKAVKRRQDVRAQTAKNVLIEDFAHHPTAVRETLKALRGAFPDSRLVAVFEPRSNTSRRKVFEEEYIQAFDEADRVILKSAAARASDEGQELISVERLAEQIDARGVSAQSFKDVPEILQSLQSEIGTETHTVFVVMSNGSFDGLPQKLEELILASAPAL